VHKVRVLIVDDEEAKLKDVERKLRKVVAFDMEIDTRSTYEDGWDALKSNYYDLVVLDLLLPSLASATPDTKHSEALINVATSGSAKSYPFVIGLTQDRQTYEEMMSSYSKRLLALELYSPSDDGWAKAIGLRMNDLVEQRRQYREFASNFSVVDLVILTARYDAEFVAILEEIDWVGKKPNEQTDTTGMTFVESYANLGGTQRHIRLVCMAQMGLSATAAISSRLISELRPKHLVMLGMCAGFRVEKAAQPAKLLDVMITREAVCWDEGKYVDDKSVGLDGFSYRPDPLALDQDLSDKFRHLIETDVRSFDAVAQKIVSQSVNGGPLAKLADDIRPKPKVSQVRNASGMNVVSRREMIEQIVGRNAGAASLEMEIYSVFQAARVHVGLRPKVICIKGVADFGEEKEGDLYDPAQPIASKLSYHALDWLAKAF